VNLIARITYSAALSAALLAASTNVLAHKTSVAPGELSVSASGQVEIAPDKATLTAALWEKTAPIPVDQSEQRDPAAMREARAALESRVADLIVTLESMGIDEKRISAGSLTVAQEHTVGDVVRNNQRERLVRTRVERPLQLTIHDLDHVPLVMDALTSAGVDRLGNAQYALQNSDQAEQEALAKAIAKAQENAKVMAEGLGESLGRVLSVTKNDRHRPAPYQPQMMRAHSEALASPSASDGPQSEYRAGVITVSAEVDVRWALEHAEVAGQ